MTSLCCTRDGTFSHELFQATTLNMRVTYIKQETPKTVVRKCSSEQMLLKIQHYSQENTCAGASLKRDYNTRVFLNVFFLKNIWERLLLKTGFHSKNIWRLLKRRLASSENKIDLENMIFNPFFPNASFLYPLKTSENRKVF